MNTFTKELLNVSDVVLRNDGYLFVWNHAFLHDACVQYEYAHQNMQRLFSTFDIQTKKIVSHIFCMPLV
jgi:hypothetical protein